MTEAHVVLSLLESSAADVRRGLAAVPAGCDLVELRADRLSSRDVPGLIRESPVATIVTARRPADGGRYSGSENDRMQLYRAALDAGAAYVDVELGSAVSELARGPDADRVILSHHGAPCRLDALRSLHREMAATSAGRLKIVPTAGRLEDARAVREFLAETAGDRRRVACFALGDRGTVTRIMAPAWGSWATYGSAATDRETAEGQLTARDLLEVYRVLDIGPDTRLFGLVGGSPGSSPSPAMHRAGYSSFGLDACYLPLEIRTIDEVERSRDCVRVESVGVTVPFKEDAFRRCARWDVWSGKSGAVNTVRWTPDGWQGFNTDASAAERLIRRRLDVRGLRAVVAGAGGTGRSLAAVLKACGSEVVVVNRTANRAQEVGRALGIDCAPWESLETRQAEIWVQSTPLGRHGEAVFSGSYPSARLVVDVVYGPDPTPAVQSARASGIAVIDGLDLLVEQGIDQFEHMTGLRPDSGTLRDAARDWLSARG